MTERFSASVAGRLMQCSASGNLDIAIPNWVEPVEDRTADNAANRGTTRHEIFAKAMDQTPGDLDRMVSAMSYVADLRRGKRFKLMIEQTVTATWLVSEPQTTADLVLYNSDELHVIDLKTGKIPVEVIGNEQLLFGAVSYAPLAPKAKGATLHILQPWANGNESWFADTNELLKFKAAAVAAEKKLRAKDITFHPSDHCTFCPANPHGRGAKGRPFCPVMLDILYPDRVDEAAILGL